MSAPETLQIAQSGGGAGLPPGRSLALAREARGITAEEVARQLKYGVKQIQALEADEYALLPGATTIRGMVRAYARLLELDAEPLLEQLRTRVSTPAPTVAVPNLAVPFPRSTRGGHWWYVVLSILFVLMALGFAADWYFGGRDALRFTVGGEAPKAVEPPPVLAESSEPPSTEPQAPVVAPIQPPVESAVGLAAGGSPAPSVTDPAPPARPTASRDTGSAAVSSSAAKPGIPEKTDALPKPAAEVAADQGRLELSFQGESWFEVRGKGGEVLLSRLGAPGSRHVVNGTPPFSIVIGVASAARLVFNGNSVDLAPHTRGSVARLTLK